MIATPVFLTKNNPISWCFGVEACYIRSVTIIIGFYEIY